MTLRERQDQFISEMAKHGSWSDKFNYLISLSKEIPALYFDFLQNYRIEGCQSRTYFKAWIYNNNLYVYGWSNSLIIAGLIVALTKIFNFSTSEEIINTEIDFHIKSGLIENVTTLRKSALEEMIRRINVLYL